MAERPRPPNFSVMPETWYGAVELLHLFSEAPHFKTLVRTRVSTFDGAKKKRGTPFENSLKPDRPREHKKQETKTKASSTRAKKKGDACPPLPNEHKS